MNEGDRLKRVLVLCLVVLMLVGCAKEEKTVKRAVFAWEGVEEADEQLLENYRIDTIFMDINHYSSIPGYNIYLLAGDPFWGVDDMEQVVEEAEEKRADGVLFDIEGDYSLLASDLSLLDSHLPIYVCIPFWLDEDVQDGIIKEADGIVVMNYSKDTCYNCDFLHIVCILYFCYLVPCNVKTRILLRRCPEPYSIRFLHRKPFCN